MYRETIDFSRGPPSPRGNYEAGAVPPARQGSRDERGGDEVAVSVVSVRSAVAAVHQQPRRDRRMVSVWLRRLLTHAGCENDSPHHTWCHRGTFKMRRVRGSLAGSLKPRSPPHWASLPFLPLDWDETGIKTGETHILSPNTKFYGLKM